MRITLIGATQVGHKGTRGISRVNVGVAIDDFQWGVIVVLKLVRGS